MQDPRREQPAPFYYEGFKMLNATPVPDDVFDLLAPRLEEGELRVLLYIIRRTFGFKKQSDDISLRQLVEGIRKRDGEVLDHGAGVSKSTAVRAIKGLVEKGIIAASRNCSAGRGYEPTTYALRFQDENQPPLFHHRTRGGSTIEQALVSPQNIQHDRSQHDREQQHARTRRTAAKPAGRQRSGLTVALTGDEDPVLVGLLRLGMTRQSAARILKAHPADKVSEWLSALSFVPNTKEPAAFLVQALKENWSLPQQYLQTQKKIELTKKKQAENDEAAAAKAAAEKARNDHRIKVDAYLALLTDEDRASLEAEALERLGRETGDYWRGRKIPGVLLKSCVRDIVAERMALPALDDATRENVTSRVEVAR
jgi:hypothetical protein